MNSKVAIMADTTAQMTQEITSQHNIWLVPLYISIDGKSYLENEVDLAWFYKQLPKWTLEDRLPVSSSPPPWDFLRAYRELSQRSEAVLHIISAQSLVPRLTRCCRLKRRLRLRRRKFLLP